MRRVLVPLDGSDLALSILPDARRLAGPDGTLILVRHVSRPEYGPQTDTRDAVSVEAAREYLARIAEQLEADGAQVEVHLINPEDIAAGIDDAVIVYKADMIACSTHGRSPLGRLVRGGVVWKVLAHSPVPVLVRNAVKSSLAPLTVRKILVPLDRSDFSERALPLARALHQEWHATVSLVTVISDTYLSAPPAVTGGSAFWRDDARRDAASYLRQVASPMPEAQLRVLSGPPVLQLTEAVRNWRVTDIVMTTHGRTGLARAVLGSVADRLIHELSIPVIVIPSFAVERIVQEEAAMASSLQPTPLA